MLKLIPTEEILIKNQFKNNISLTNNSILYLNTYGSLYSIDRQSLKINWFINLNKSTDINPSNLFFGSEILSYDNKIIISSKENTYVIDELTGSTLYKNNIISQIKPIINSNYLFTVTKNNLLIAMDINSGKVIYSLNINNKIKDKRNLKKFQLKFKSIFIIKNKIFIFLKNSHYLKFDIKGDLIEIKKLPNIIKSEPIFVNNFLYYFNNKNRISIVN